MTPELSVIVPVWATSEDLVRMTQAAMAQVMRVARVPTETILIDQGCTVGEAEYDVTVLVRWPENVGIAPAWNAGATMARGSTLVWLNNDCVVEPGWDEALIAAAQAGHIAFPYTDHGDGRYRAADTAGCAGWCFAASVDTWRRVGRFDETFVPAFYEDTDWLHRAWALGIPLSPVPAAHVRHQRRTTAKRLPRLDLLVTANRFRYAWKHGVDYEDIPPFYTRAIVPFAVPEFAGKEG